MTNDSSDIAKAIEEAALVASRADNDSIEVLSSAESFAILNDIQYGQSGELLKAIKAKQSELSSLRLSITRPVDEVKSRIMQLFKPAAGRLQKAEEAIKNAMLAFSQDQESKRRKAQAKLDEAAAKERERLDTLADTQRERGQDKRAEATEQRAESVPALTVTAPAPKVAGIGTRRTWRAEVIDLRALARAVADGSVPLSFLAPNMAELNAAARLQRDALAIPGVSAISEDTIVARRD